MHRLTMEIRYEKLVDFLDLVVSHLRAMPEERLSVIERNIWNRARMLKQEFDYRYDESAVTRTEHNEMGSRTQS